MLVGFPGTGVLLGTTGWGVFDGAGSGVLVGGGLVSVGGIGVNVEVGLGIEIDPFWALTEMGLPFVSVKVIVPIERAVDAPAEPTA